MEETQKIKLSVPLLESEDQADKEAAASTKAFRLFRRQKPTKGKKDDSVKTNCTSLENSIAAAKSSSLQEQNKSIRNAEANEDAKICQVLDEMQSKSTNDDNKTLPKTNQAVEKRPDYSTVAPTSSAPASGGSGGNSIIVSQRQRGNPIFKYLRNVPYQFGETVADFDLGSGCCVIYLSLKFHRRHPDYISMRFKEIGHAYPLQILLVLSDIEESEQRLRELNQMCVFGGWSVILAFSVEEAAEYLELYKIYEHKSADILHGIERDLL